MGKYDNVLGFLQRNTTRIYSLLEKETTTKFSIIYLHNAR
jgi:hypothetical protein